MVDYNNDPIFNQALADAASAYDLAAIVARDALTKGLGGESPNLHGREVDAYWRQISAAGDIRAQKVLEAHWAAYARALKVTI